MKLLRGAWMRRPVRQSWLVLAASLAFLIGVALAQTGWLIDFSWSLLALGGVIWTIKYKRVWALLFVVLFALSLGWWRGSVYAQHLAAIQAYYDQKVTLVGRASDDAAINPYKQDEFVINNPTVDGRRLTGQFRVSGFGVPDVFAGDLVRAEGKLRPGYGSAQGEMSYAKLAIEQPGGSLIDQIRRRFAAGMQTALPAPLAAFGMGLLIGDKVDLPDGVYQSLLMVGLVHIIAVSGYNLTVILRASNRLLSKRSRRLSTLLALGLIGIFLLLAGSSASIVRAAIVSVLAIGAAYYGRQVKPLVLILLAAAITGWLDPYYVWGNVSWYLSFLAFFGVLVVAPLVMARLPQRLSKSLVANMAVESLSAELMTIPYVLLIFGQMSLIGLPANLLVVALTPLAMLLCLIAGLAGMLAPMLAGWLAWPAVMLLNYMLDTASLLSHIPHIFLEHIKLGLGQLAVLYLALASVVVVLWRRARTADFSMHLSPVDTFYRDDAAED